MLSNKRVLKLYKQNRDRTKIEMHRYIKVIAQCYRRITQIILSIQFMRMKILQL